MTRVKSILGNIRNRLHFKNNSNNSPDKKQKKSRDEDSDNDRILNGIVGGNDEEYHQTKGIITAPLVRHIDDNNNDRKSNSSNKEVRSTLVLRRFLVKLNIIDNNKINFILFVLFFILALIVRAAYKFYPTYRHETQTPFFHPISMERGVAPPVHVFTFPTIEERVQYYMGGWYDYHDYYYYYDATNTNTTTSSNTSSWCNQAEYRTKGMARQKIPNLFDWTNLKEMKYEGKLKLPWRYERGYSADAYNYHFTLATEQQQQQQQHKQQQHNQQRHQTIRKIRRGKQPRRKKVNNNLRMIFQFGDVTDGMTTILSTTMPVITKSRLSKAYYQMEYETNTSATSKVVVFETAAASLVENNTSRDNNNNNNNDNNVNAVVVQHDNNDTDNHDRHPRRHPPIIGMLNTHRHFGFIMEVHRIWDKTTAWEDKKDVVLWRGTTSGYRIPVITKYYDPSPTPKDFDIAFSGLLSYEVWDDHQKDGKSIKDQISYKYLLSLEGWDVASALKWMLYSSSVVFMAPPRKVSWTMEEWLVPYVHYVPLKEDISDLKEQLEWARSHDEECHRMALASTKFIEDLLLTKKAHEETKQVLARMTTVYHENFGEALASCPTTTISE